MTRKSFHCPELRPVRHFEAYFSISLKTEPEINYNEPVTQHHRNRKILIRMQHSQHRKNLTIPTTVRNYRMISEAKTAKRILFTCPSKIIFWQLTGSGEDIEDFLGRKLFELDSGILCEQCWDILLGIHEIELVKRDIPGTFHSPRKWAIFDHLSRHSQVVVLKAVRNGHLFR